MKTAEWLKENYSEFIIHCKNTHRRIGFFEEMLDKYAQECTKDIFLFAEWTGKEGIYWRGNRWYYLNRDWSSEKLFDHWLKEVKK